MDDMVVMVKGRAMGKTSTMMQDIIAKRDPNCLIYGEAIIRRLRPVAGPSGDPGGLRVLRSPKFR
jgi:hypothetical protein